MLHFCRPYTIIFLNSLVLFGAVILLPDDELEFLKKYLGDSPTYYTKWEALRKIDQIQLKLICTSIYSDLKPTTQLNIQITRHYNRPTEYYSTLQQRYMMIQLDLLECDIKFFISNGESYFKQKFFLAEGNRVDQLFKLVRVQDSTALYFAGIAELFRTPPGRLNQVASASPQYHPDTDPILTTGTRLQPVELSQQWLASETQMEEPYMKDSLNVNLELNHHKLNEEENLFSQNYRNNLTGDAHLEPHESGFLMIDPYQSTNPLPSQLPQVQVGEPYLVDSALLENQMNFQELNHNESSQHYNSSNIYSTSTNNFQEPFIPGSLQSSLTSQPILNLQPANSSHVQVGERDLRDSTFPENQINFDTLSHNKSLQRLNYTSANALQEPSLPLLPIDSFQPPLPLQPILQPPSYMQIEEPDFRDSTFLENQMNFQGQSQNESLQHSSNDINYTSANVLQEPSFPAVPIDSSQPLLPLQPMLQPTSHVQIGEPYTKNFHKNKRNLHAYNPVTSKLQNIIPSIKRLLYARKISNAFKELIQPNIPVNFPPSTSPVSMHLPLPQPDLETQIEEPRISENVIPETQENCHRLNQVTSSQQNISTEQASVQSTLNAGTPRDAMLLKLTIDSLVSRPRPPPNLSHSKPVSRVQMKEPHIVHTSAPVREQNSHPLKVSFSGQKVSPEHPSTQNPSNSLQDATQLELTIDSPQNSSRSKDVLRVQIEEPSTRDLVAPENKLNPRTINQVSTILNNFSSNKIRKTLSKAHVASSYNIASKLAPPMPLSQIESPMLQPVSEVQSQGPYITDSAANQVKINSHIFSNSTFSQHHLNTLDRAPWESTLQDDVTMIDSPQLLKLSSMQAKNPQERNSYRDAVEWNHPGHVYADQPRQFPSVQEQDDSFPPGYEVYC